MNELVDRNQTMKIEYVDDRASRLVKKSEEKIMGRLDDIEKHLKEK